MRPIGPRIRRPWWIFSRGSRHGLAWEAGCGSGQLSVDLARRFDRVIATDASDAQLARARPHPRVTYRRARAEHSGLPDAERGSADGTDDHRTDADGTGVDLAVAAQAAHWFDVGAYFEEVRRVGAPDAAFALVSYGPTRISAELDPLVEAFRVGELAPWWPPQRRHVEDGYRSLPFPFDEVPEADLPELEIRREWTLDDFLAYVRTWSALRGMGEAEAASRLVALRTRLAPAWGEGGGRRRTVAWPLAIRAGRL